MADQNNSELMEYLKAEFAKMATKDDLAKMATKEDLRTEIAKMASKEDLAKMASKEDLAEAMRHTGILFEDVHHKLDLIIEGFVGANQNLEKHKEENAQEFSRLDKMDLINVADISKLDQRVIRLEGKV